MSLPSLTENCIGAMFRGEDVGQPTVQLADIRKIVTSHGGERFRVILSDGKHFIQGMIATTLAAQVASGAFKQYAVVVLRKFACNNINGKQVCIITEADNVGQGDQTIGKPVPVQQSGKNAQPQQQQQQQPQASPPQQAARQQPPSQQSYQSQSSSSSSSRQMPRFVGGSGGGGGNNGQHGAPVQPVKSLNPYQNNWCIKVRCTSKDEMRHYSNQRGNGKVFSVDLLDSDGGEIRATMFNDSADKFFAVFKKNQVYKISKGVVKIVRDKRYSRIKNDYSITLNSDAIVEALNDDNAISAQNYKFVSLKSLESVQENSYVDVLGVVTEFQEPRSIQTKKGDQLMKREVTITDKTAKVQLTLWGDTANKYDNEFLNSKPVLAVQGARVSSFGGRTLSGGMLDMNPNIPEVSSLQQWYQTGAAQDIKTITTGGGGGPADPMAIKEVLEKNLGNNPEKPKGEYFQLTGTITTISHSLEKLPWYKAAPETNSKVVEESGGWFSVRDQKTYSHYVPRYILRFAVRDHSGQLWFSTFNDQAEEVLNKTTAKTAEELVNNGDTAGFERIFKDACFKRWVFTCRAKSDLYQDERRTRYDVVNIKELDVDERIAELKEKCAAIENTSHVQ